MQNAKPRIAVVTAIAGGKNRLKDPATVFPSADYHAFCDEDHPDVNVWKIHPLPRWSADAKFGPRRDAKLPKILPELILPGYDYYIWHDPTNELVVDPIFVLDFLPPDGALQMAVFKHRHRKCIYQEAKEVLKFSLDIPENVRSQVREYKSRGFPEDKGLYELGIILKKPGNDSLKLSLSWWEQVNRYSSRDQLSFPFSLWHCGFDKLAILPGNVVDNDFFPRVSDHQIRHWKAPLLMRVRLSSIAAVKNLLRPIYKRYFK